MNWAEFIAECLPEPHTVTVQPLTGSGGYGPVYGQATPVTPCVVEHTRRRVPVQTQDAAGAEVLSSTTVYCPPGTVAPPGSLVTLPTGDVSRVLSVSILDAAGWDVPEHVELALE